jgi:hypothetical protein
MKEKILHLLLILTSLIAYMEWGGNNAAFLFQAEAQVLTNFFRSPQSALHPLTILPFLGQVLLLIALLMPKPPKALSLLGMVGLGSLIGVLFIFGLLAFQWKTVLSTLPFLLVSTLTIRHLRRPS